MDKMTVLITGSKGMLGSDLCQYLTSYTMHNIIPTSRKDMDITKWEEVWNAIKKNQPDLIIHTAAEANADLCEEDPHHAFLTNTMSTQFIATSCRNLNIPLVFISTCGLFNGKKDSPYTEYDPLKPLTVYAKSKTKAEEAVRAIWGSHFIIRPGWLFGGNIEHRKNFVAKIYSEAKGKDELVSAADRFGSPTYTIDLARKIIEVVEMGVYGTYHIANFGMCSRFEYVSEIVKCIGLNIKIKPVDSSYFPRYAPVPASEALENYNLNLMGLNDMRSWREALHDYISARFLRSL
ncbi:MAG TPA: dTDP-4-dehydrorhamnose reductase [Candidatus Atribacteria bacterium]|uniref:dTDP-4-dehydrorhamnose reductase n=1 Tax=candidate division TA06 bacterium 34_109 TaxID=1635277 RepID=A0A101I0K2_UNCT6|nr:MAG: dtdp-4-dehydrorhamnose reductase [candidate division TA06 bacterium 34_109]HBY58154.1 dTDP-4-dehydrorhamnose reductase [Candidatus Atribacteria bacterium]